MCPGVFLYPNVIYISFSLYLSLLHFLPSSPASKVYLCWAWMKYLSQDSSQSLYKAFSLNLLIPYQINKQWCRMKSLVRIETFQLDHLTHTLFPWSAIHFFPPWPPYMYCGICGPMFDSEINTLSTRFTWGILQVLVYLKQSPPGWSGIVDLLAMWLSGFVFGALGNELCKSTFFSELAYKHQYDYHCSEPWWKWARVHIFSHPKLFSVWNTLHPFLDPLLSDGLSLLCQEWNAKALSTSLHHRAHGG